MNVHQNVVAENELTEVDIFPRMFSGMRSFIILYTISPTPAMLESKSSIHIHTWPLMGGEREGGREGEGKRKEGEREREEEKERRRKERRKDRKREREYEQSGRMLTNLIF